MKTLNAIIATILMLSVLGISTHSLAQDTVSVTVGEWPPYISVDSKHYGLAPDITSEAFALEGVTVEYVFYPWKRAYVIAKDGERDATLQKHLTPEESALITHHQKPIEKWEYCLPYLVIWSIVRKMAYGNIIKR